MMKSFSAPVMTDFAVTLLDLLVVPIPLIASLSSTLSVPVVDSMKGGIAATAQQAQLESYYEANAYRICRCTSSKVLRMVESLGMVLRIAGAGGKEMKCNLPLPTQRRRNSKGAGLGTSAKA